MFDQLITVSGIVVGLAALFIGLSVSYDVLARQLFGSTTSWVVDVNTYLVAFITFIGAGYGLREQAHVRVDLITRRLPLRLRWLLQLLSDLIVIGVTSLLFWLGALYCHDAWTSGEQSFGLFAVPLWIPYAALPIGMAILLVVQLLQSFDTVRRGPMPAHEEAESLLDGRTDAG
ncbi:TRAP transporter small permease [Salinisphaera sp. T31B1]|uniref:TRAP transporter small permease n=1 Tax=Salinisphaera sp. T31B1 TaxID=727963 RepID=UPI00334069E0